jgi:hypothetical protein
MGGERKEILATLLPVAKLYIPQLACSDGPGNMLYYFASIGFSALLAF